MVNVFDPLVFDPLVLDTGSHPSPPGGGFAIFRNGVLDDMNLDNDQLLAMRFVKAAYDGEIGMGTITVPDRTPSTWNTGDRITIQSTTAVLYTGFIMKPVVERNPNAPLEIQTTWQLMDVNRQLIGRKVVEWSIGGGQTASQTVQRFLDFFMTDLVLDLTWFGTNSTLIPDEILTGDGVMDVLARLIQYTGWTLYLTPSPNVENYFELHFHDLTGGPLATLTISDIGAAVTGDTFAPQNPRRTWEDADLKDNIEARNGTRTVVAIATHRHDAGGLKWEAVLDYGGISEDNLIVVANNLITTTDTDRISYSVTIGPLTGAQVAKIPAGSRIRVTSTVMNLTDGIDTPKRISHVTLSVSRDLAGNAMPGFWDAELELNYPLRQPAAVVNYGGQGGDLGRLSIPRTWDDTRVTEDDPLIGGDGYETVTCQLLYRDAAIADPGVTINWLVVMDDADTPHPFWETLDDLLAPATTSLTDESGQAHIIAHHLQPDANPHRVKAYP